MKEQEKFTTTKNGSISGSRKNKMTGTGKEEVVDK